ncbi:recQ [Mytilus coruscus]|uniref:DNA 3'-5' helicase n=1 Tax=Mytilus coruscus TaxID=42192 RepID=A0A6J8EZI8_MYTCO|nr:recQ [Mytilus coruscus]
MASFEDCINFCQSESGLFSSSDIILKEKQLETLKALYFNKDCISVLPTGYGTKGITFEEDDDTENELETDVPFEQLQKGEYQILYVHPETFSNKKFGKLMRSEAYQTNVCCIVIDEVHMISEWGESFRPEFMKLGELTCLFETAGHLALTATATPKALKELEVILNYGKQL